MTASGFIVFGAGHWHAPWYLKALLDAGQTVLAVSDASDTAARQLVDGRDIAVFADPMEMLERRPEAVALVLTRPSETPALLSRLLDRGMPFVLEKPGTVDAPALAPTVEALRRTGLRTAVPFVNRDMDFWAETRGLQAHADDWTYAHFRILAGPPDRYRRDNVGWVLDPAIYGGGALRNLGVHAADAALTLAGTELSVRSATVSNRLHGLPVEDFAQATLETRDGRTITIEAGYCMPAENAADKEWRVQGLDWAVAESNGQLSLRTPKGRASRPSAPSASQYHAFGLQMAAFARGETIVGATVDDLYKAQGLVDRIYAAATANRSS
ncbi:MAG TPA: Gfo/Idh/MocA family oxidoreductase [Devosiaceae bacterium]|jgi:predicted dehydrogenase